MPQIRSLKPNVTREDAMAQFSRGGVPGSLRTAAFGPLRSVAEFYIPFWLFQVEIANGSKLDQRVLGLDAVTGALDLYLFQHLPGPEVVVGLETRNCAQPLLDESQGQELVTAKVRRLLFTTGFFRIRNLRISAELVPGEICIPYWVGFRGRGASAHATVMDAVRRRIEGAKVRKILQEWLVSAR